MLSTSGRPPLRPRPPSQRKACPQPSRPEAETQQCRQPLSEVKNLVDNATSQFAVLEHLDKSNSHHTPAKQQSATIHTNVAAASSIEPESPASATTSEQDLNHELLGTLERHELEELLIEASRKVRERERKLAIAANIGKALLEKNLTLRSGIMTTMASSSSICALNDIEAMIQDFPESGHFAAVDDIEHHGTNPHYSSFGPTNSPPTTDIDIYSLGATSPEKADSDTTPIAHPISLPATAQDYFSRPTTATTDHPSDVNLGIDRSVWMPSDVGLIASQPCSPSASASSFASHALLSPHSTISRNTSKGSTVRSRHRPRPSHLQPQALEAQKHLASLQEQNDVLHQQISELQHEAESARYDGSKKLSRLNKEIRGLKAELEAATRRNVELESHELSARPTLASRTSSRDSAIRHASDPASPFLLRVRDLQEADTAAKAPPRFPAVEAQPMPDHHGLLPSTSNLEMLVRSAQNVNGESALLAQLLAKIKELEETNSAMARAEEDFGSRMGRAMEEDERLRDAFNTVGQDLAVQAASTGSHPELTDALDAASPRSSKINSSNMAAKDLITPSHSLRSLDLFGSAGSPSILSSVSPSPKRRAPGNRHVIENRKTVRKAIRRATIELADDIWGLDSNHAPVSAEYMSRSSTEQSLGTYSIDLSGDSSAASSPRRKGLNRKVSSNSMALGPAGRPRIRITPSIEDLGQRRKMDEEVITGPSYESSNAGDWQDLASPTASNFQTQASLRPSDAMHAYSGRSGGSSRYSRDDSDSPSSVHLDAPTAFSHCTTTLPLLSPSQHRSFRPTARVRRSRSRSSSFGSEVRSGSQASSIQQSADPFLSGQATRNRRWQPSPASVSSYRGRTLGSELGSIFGGDDRKDDFDDDLPQRRRTPASIEAGSDLCNKQFLVLHSPSKAAALTLRSKIAINVESERPTTNFGRLVPENVEEHADDLECVLTQSVYGPVEDVFLDDSLIHPRDAALLARHEAEEHGIWLADQPIIEQGGLHDEDEPRSAQYDLINAVVEQEAVAWADDDDYGRTITVREAVKLGLLAPDTSAQASRSARLLRDKTKHGASLFSMARSTKSDNAQQTGASKAASPFRLEIESAEQVEHRLRIETLLRRRRQQLLRERGFAEGWEQDAQVREQEDRLVAAYAPTPQRFQQKRRQTLMSGKSSDWLTSPTGASPSSHDPCRSTRRWVQELACVSPSTKSRGRADEEFDHMDLDCVLPEDGEFELLDCPSWKKQGGRGTDYFPTSLRARYRPAMVKQRFVHASQVTIGWVEEWVQFAFVVFLAFIVMVEQGPHHNMRRGKPTAPVPKSLMHKAQ